MAHCTIYSHSVDIHNKVYKYQIIILNVGYPKFDLLIYVNKIMDVYISNIGYLKVLLNIVHACPKNRFMDIPK